MVCTKTAVQNKTPCIFLSLKGDRLLLHREKTKSHAFLYHFKSNQLLLWRKKTFYESNVLQITLCFIIFSSNCMFIKLSWTSFTPTSTKLAREYLQIFSSYLNLFTWGTPIPSHIFLLFYFVWFIFIYITCTFHLYFVQT